MQSVITNPIELLEILAIDTKKHASLITQIKNFPLLVPRNFVARMQKGNFNDPLLRQVLPLAAEKKIVAGFSKDPLAEHKINPIPGLLHKYPNRVLIITNHACPINCRFCFRRHSLKQKNNLNLTKILSYINNNNSISEVILSGGEPLLLSDKKLQHLFVKFAAIKHVKYLRIHTRMPIIFPERINNDFIKYFTGTRLQPIMVVHCNHANEIDKNVHKAMRQLKQAGITLLNQSVLLKGINDSADTLIKLSNKLFAIGVLPYYLKIFEFFVIFKLLLRLH